jgi:hypothetical protein
VASRGSDLQSVAIIATPCIDVFPKRGRRGGSITLPPVVLMRICVVAKGSDVLVMCLGKKYLVAMI